MTAKVHPHAPTEDVGSQDVHWKEVNAEFGGSQEATSQDDCPEVDKSTTLPQYRHLDFDFEELDSCISLRTTVQAGASTGLAVWTCSQILSAYLAEHSHHVRHRRVLELGAGLGLCGIVAHKLGAHHVTLTDGDVDVLHSLRYNAQQNKITTTQNIATMACPQFVWGQEHLAKFQETHGAVHDVIIAADVFYAAHLVQPLWQSIDALLAPDGRFLLGFCPHAVSAKVVLEAARAWGFTWSCPNITETNENEEESISSSGERFDDFVPNGHGFGYHVFHFQRVAQQ